MAALAGCWVVAVSGAALAPKDKARAVQKVLMANAVLGFIMVSNGDWRVGTGCYARSLADVGSVRHSGCPVNDVWITVM